MRKDDYVFIRTNHEGRKLLKMYAAKHNLTMLGAVVVLAKEALEREERMLKCGTRTAFSISNDDYISLYGLSNT